MSFARLPLGVSASFGCLVLLAIGSSVVGVVAPAGPNVGDLAIRLQAPSLTPSASATHLLGTDHLGRDMLVRLLFSGGVSLIVSVSAVFLSCTFGTLVGLLAGYIGGRLDYVLMRVADIQLAMPFLALAVLISAVLGPGLSNVIAVLAISGWVLYARVVRASALTVRDLEYVWAARAIGAGPARIVLRTVLPNIFGPVVVMSSLAVSQMIIAESSLSFIGLGVTPATPTWGTMLGDARSYLTVAWWVPTFPGIAITATVVAVNVIGDWLVDAMNPRLSR